MSHVEFSESRKLLSLGFRYISKLEKEKYVIYFPQNLTVYEVNSMNLKVKSEDIHGVRVACYIIHKVID